MSEDQVSSGLPDTVGGWLDTSREGGAGCPDVDAWARYASGEASESERAELERHARACAVCEAEEELARAFASTEKDRSAETPNADVRAIERQLRAGSVSTQPMVRSEAAGEPPPETSPPPSPALSRSLPSWLAAAGVLLALVGLLQWQRTRVEPLPDPLSEDVVRGAVVELTQPIGDLDGLPQAFEWTAVDGAAIYRLEIRRVDDTLLWSTTSAVPSADLPSGPDEVGAPRLLSGVTYHWSVTALDARGGEIARSTPAALRVAPKSGDSP